MFTVIIYLVRLPLKVALRNLYQEDMAKALELIARRSGLQTSYENVSSDGRAKRIEKQNLARKKRLYQQTDDADGPPDTKRKFQPGIYLY